MEKKTIGSFIAVLRKASGMTQQDMADKLNVSNKAISRWEREECAPDLMLIPVIAEMFGVSCDELLKGERIVGNVNHEKVYNKIDKQVKQIVKHIMSQFKISITFAVAATLIGVILLLSISYGFTKPIIGFSVMSVFVLASMVVTLLALNKLNEQFEGNEIFETLNELEILHFKKTRYRFTRLSLLINLSVMFCSLPFILVRSEYVADSVINFYEYFIFYLPYLVLITLFLYLKIDAFYCSKIFNENKRFKSEPHAKVINKIQVIISVMFSLMWLLALSLRVNRIGFLLNIILLSLIMSLFIAIFICIKNNRLNSKLIITTGVRNIGFFFSGVIGVAALFLVDQGEEYTRDGESYLLATPSQYQIMSFAVIIFLISIGVYSLGKKYWVK